MVDLDIFEYLQPIKIPTNRMPSMNPPKLEISDDVCSRFAPKSLREAISKSPLLWLDEWKKDASTPELEEAIGFIHSHQSNILSSIQVELAMRRHTELKKPHWTLKWTFGLVLVSTIISLLAWLAPREPIGANKLPVYQHPEVALPLAASTMTPEPLSKQPPPPGTITTATSISPQPVKPASRQ